MDLPPQDQAKNWSYSHYAQTAYLDKDEYYDLTQVWKKSRRILDDQAGDTNRGNWSKQGINIAYISALGHLWQLQYNWTKQDNYNKPDQDLLGNPDLGLRWK